MMCATPTAKQCPHCGAPALHDRTECWSCGEPLALATAPPAAALIPPPEEYLRPCPECGEVSAIYHARCRACGFPLSAALPPRLSDVPFGSDAELLPDGTVRLQASRTTRTLRLAVALVAVIAVAYLSYAFSTVPPAHYALPSREAMRVLGVPLFFGLFLVSVVWAVFGSEVWEVGADRLVVRRALFGREWTRQYSGGTLRVETRYGSRGRQIRSLVAQTAQGRVSLAADGVGAASVRDLGAFLSRVTGWPLQDNTRGRL